MTENGQKRVSERHLRAIKRRHDGRVETIEDLVHLTAYKYIEKEPGQT